MTLKQTLTLTHRRITLTGHTYSHPHSHPKFDSHCHSRPHSHFRPFRTVARWSKQNFELSMEPVPKRIRYFIPVCIFVMPRFARTVAHIQHIPPRQLTLPCARTWRIWATGKGRSRSAKTRNAGFSTSSWRLKRARSAHEPTCQRKYELLIPDFQCQWPLGASAFVDAESAQRGSEGRGAERNPTESTLRRRMSLRVVHVHDKYRSKVFNTNVGS